MKDTGLALHRYLQYLNTVLLTVIGFFGMKTYDVIMQDHEKLANHEVRISVLEEKNKQTSYTNFRIESILPNELKQKSECGNQ